MKEGKAQTLSIDLPVAVGVRGLALYQYDCYSVSEVVLVYMDDNRKHQLPQVAARVGRVLRCCDVFYVLS